MGLRWEDIDLDDLTAEVTQAVVYAGSSRRAVIKQPKTIKSSRTIIIPRALADILQPCKQSSGYIIHGADPNKPACYSRMQRLSRAAFAEVGINGKYDNHDWRATYATQLAEAGMSSKNVAGLLGQADTRMVDAIYARTRRESILKQRGAVENLNADFV